MNPNFYKISESISSLNDDELEELFNLIQTEKEDRLIANAHSALEELVKCIKEIENKYNVYFTYNWDRIYPDEIECENNE